MKPRRLLSAARLSFPLACALAALFNLAAPSAFGVNLYWDSNGTTTGAGATPTGTWGTSLFWNTTATGLTTTPTNATTTGVDDLFFSAGTDAVNAYTVTVNGSQNARLLTFEDGTASLSGGTLITLGGGGGITVGTSTVTGATISTALTLNGNNTFNVGASRTLTLNTGAFNRGTRATLNVQGAGTVTSTKAGLATGGMVNGIIGPWASIGTGTSTRYATFTGNNITALTGTTRATPSAVISTAGTENTELTGVGTSPTTFLFGAGASINTLRYSGAAGTIGTNALLTKGVMNAGTGTLTFTGALSAGAAGNEMVINTASADIAMSTATGLFTGTITKTGSGTFTLGNGANHVISNITVNQGTVVTGATGGDGLGNAGVTINSGGTLKFGSANKHGNASLFTVNAGGIFDINGQQDTIGAVAGAGSITNTGASQTLILASGTQTFSGVISGAMGLTISNAAAVQTLSGANTYTGVTTVNAGTLILNHATALGGNNPGVNGTSGISMAATGILRADLTGFSTTAPITLGGTGNITIAAGTNTAVQATFSGAIGGTTGDLIFTSLNNTSNPNHAITLGATSNYTGNTTITVGNIGNNLTVKAGGLNSLSPTTVLTMDGGGASNTAAGRAVTYDLNGNNQTLAGLTNTTAGHSTSRNQRVTNSGALATLTINNSTDYTFGGTTTDTEGTGSAQITGAIALTKSGAGNFTLGGPLGGTAAVSGHTYTGATSIIGGTLTIASTGALANTAISATNVGSTFAVTPLAADTVNLGNTGTVGAGASLNLGSGTIFSMVNGAAGGTTNLVQEATYATNALTLNGATLNFELGGATADKLAVTGALATASVTGVNTINLTGLAALTASSYDLITTANAAGGLSTGGTFAFGNGLTTGAVTTGAGAYVVTLNNSANVESVSVGASAAAMTWTGQTAGNGLTDTSWNTTASTNFAVGTIPVAFNNGNAVTFQDSNTVATGNVAAPSLAVSVQAGGVSPGWTTFDNTAVDYTVSNASGVIGIGGTGGLTKTGSGTVTLTGPNSFTGNVTISAGKLIARDPGALAAAGRAVSIGTSATLDLQTDTSSNALNTTVSGTGATIISNKLTASTAGITHTLGTLSIGAHTLNITTGANATGTTAGVAFGAATLTGAANFAPAANTSLTFNSTTDLGTNLLTKSDAGSMTLTGVVSGSTAAGSNAMSISDGVLTASSAGNTFTGNIAVDGSGVFAMAGTTYTSAAPYGASGTANVYKQLLLTNGGTFRLTSGSFNNNGTVTNQAGGIIFNIGTGGGTLDIASNATLIIDDGTGTGTGGAASQIQGSGTITKTGLGIFQQDDSTAFAGAMIIAAGTFQPATANAGGATSAGTTIESGARYNVNGITMTNQEPLTINGTGLAAAPAGALTNASGTAAIWVGPVTLGSAATIGSSAGGGLTLSSSATVNTAGNDLTLAISGSGRIFTDGVISGTGAVILNGSSSGDYVPRAAHTYIGGTTLNAGSFTAVDFTSTGPAGNPTAGAFGSGTAPLVLNGGQMRSGTGASRTIGNTVTISGDTTFYTVDSEKSLTFTGPVTLSGGNRILTTNVGTTVAGTSTTFSGAIGDGGNNLGLFKAGTGNLVLSGPNTYTGVTGSTGGNLLVTGSLANNSGLSIAPAAASGAFVTFINNAANTPANFSSLTFGSAAGTSFFGLDLGTASDQLATTAAATATGQVTFHLNAVAGFGAGSYNLVSAASGLTAGGATYSLGTLPGGHTYVLSSTDSLVQLTATAATAGGRYWRGNLGTSWATITGPNTNWATDAAGTVVSAATPGTGDTVFFSATGATGPAITTTVDNSFTINDLQFLSAPTDVTSVTINPGMNPGTLSAGTLTLAPSLATAGLAVAQGAGAVTIAAPITLGAPQTWSLDSSTPGSGTASSLTVSGAISGIATNGLTFTTPAGTSPIILSAAGTSTYSGPSTVSAATIVQGGATNAFSPNTAWTINGTMNSGAFSQNTGSLVGGSGIVQNGSATNATLTIGSDNNASPATFAGTIQNGSTGTLGITKAGTGTQFLSGTNSYTGGTTVSAGTLNLTNTNTFGAGTITVGNAAGNAVLNLSGSANLTLTGATTVGAANGANGAVNISGGTFASTAAGLETNFNFGSATGGYGYLGISGGIVSTNRLQFGGQATGTTTGTGTGLISSGTTTASEYILIARNTNALGSLTITGGTLNHLASGGGAASNNIALAYSGGTGVLNMQGGNLNSEGRNLTVRQGGTGTATGIVNLNGGTLAVNAITNTSGTAYLNFNGGTLQAGAATQTLVPNNFTGIYVNSSGGTINNGGLAAITVAGNLLAPAGNGVTGVAVTNGGSGYIGAPFVTITDSGTGVSATAIANMVDDLTGNGTFKIDSFTVTNPGVNFTGTQTVTLTGGGGSGAVVGTVSTGALTSGGMTFTGTGTTILTGTGSTYTGGTMVSGGTLALGVNGGLPTNGNLTVNSNGTFDAATFNNSVGTVILQSGGITGSTGVITSNADYDLRSGTVNFTGTGGLAGAVGLNKSTAGTVTLSGATSVNSFNGTVSVTAGTLAFATGNHLGNGSLTNTLSVNGTGATLSYTGSTTTSLAANQVLSIGSSGGTLDASDASGVLNLVGGVTIASAANLTKTGLGTISVTGSTNLNGGNVTVSAGILNAGFTSTGLGGINVATGATLNLYDGDITTMAINALTLAGGSSLGFDLDAPTENDILTLTGTASVSPAVSLNFNNLGGLAAGTYDLLNVTAGTLAAGNYTLGLAPSGLNYAFSTINSDHTLRLTTSALSLVYWTGDQDGNWNTNNATDTNWASNASGATDLGVLPIGASTLVFSATNANVPAGVVATSLNNVGVTADSLRFIDAPTSPATSTVTIASGGVSGTLTLTPLSSNNGISVATNAGAISISAPVTAGAIQTWEVAGGGLNGSSLSVGGDVTFANPVTKTGNGVLTLSGPANSGAGGFVLSAGTLNLASNNALGTGTFTVAPGTALDATGGTRTLSNGAYAWNGNFAFTGSSNLDLGAGGVTLGGDVILTASGSTLTVGGVVGGASSLTKAGAGTLVLGANNTYTGVTILSGGVLRITKDSGLGTTGSGTVQSGTSALELDGSGGALTVGTEALTINGGGITDLGALRNIAGNNTYGGTVTLAAQSRINSDSGTLTLSNPTAVTGAAQTLGVGGAGNTTIAGAVALGSGGLIKDGRGTLTLSGTNTYTGNTSVNGGTIQITAGASLSTAKLLVGYGATASGAVIFTNDANLSFSPGTGADFFSLGGGGGYGYARNAGGTVTSGQLALGGNSAGIGTTGVFEQTGGAYTMGTAAGWVLTGWQGTDANGVVNVFGGTFNNNSTSNPTAHGFLTSVNSFGMYNVLGPTAVFNANITSTAQGFDLARTAGNFAGVLNINGGGTVATNFVRATNATSPSFLSFDSGTLKANSANTTFVNGLSNATIYSGGATIDSNGFNVTIPQALLAPTGLGVTSIPLVTGGSGYIGAPVVRISGGGGTGASAIANVDLDPLSATYGQVTGFTITSAGSGYTSAPTVTLIGGGATATATNGTAVTSANNVSGGLTKIGANTLTLSGNNTYTGPTTITAGTLSVGAANNLGATASNLVFNGGTLQITGTALTSLSGLGHTVILTPDLTVGLDINSAGHTFTADQVLNQGTGGLTKLGAGVLVLNQTNTYTGPTTLTAGTLSVGASDNLGGAASNLVFDGGTLQITGTTLGDFSTIGHTVSFNTGKTVGLDINNSAHTFTADQVLNQGAGGLTKLGLGTLVLSQANTYTGTTTINQGTVRVTGSAVLGGATGSTADANNIVFGQSLNSGALEFATVANLGAADQIRFRNTGGTDGQGGALVYIGTTHETLGKTIQCDTSIGIRIESNSVGGSLTFNGPFSQTNRSIYLGGTGTGNNTIATAFTGTGGVTKRDAGTWILSGANSYTGATTVASGTLIVSGTGTLGVPGAGVTGVGTAAGSTGTLVISSSSATALNMGTGSGSIYIGQNVTGTSAGVLYLAPGMGSTGAVTQASTSADINIGWASGATGNATGTIYQSAGTFTQNASGRAFYLGLVTTAGGIGTGTYNIDGGTLSTNSKFYLSGTNSSTNTFATGSVSGTLNISGTGVVTATGTFQPLFAGAAAAITKSATINLNSFGGNSGVLQTAAWTGASTGNATLNFNGGTLRFGATGSSTFLSATTSAVNIYANGATIDTNGNSNTITQAFQNPADNAVASVSISGTSATYTTPPAVTFGGAAGTLPTGYGVLDGSGAITGIVVTNGGSYTGTLTAGIAGSGLTLAPVTAANNTGGLTKIGAGTLTLSGTNTYAGATTISAGTLSVGASNNLGAAASNLVFDGGTLQITGATLSDFSTIGHTVSFNPAKNVGLDINSSTHTFTVDQVLNQTTGGFTKAGAGTVVLNQVNTYSGPSTISAGTLQISAADNLGDGSATNTITLGAATLRSTAGTYDLGATRDITLTNAAAKIQADAGTLTLSGDITNGANNLALLGVGTDPLTTGKIVVTGVIGTGATPTGGLTIGSSALSANVTLSGNNLFTGNVSLPASNAQPYSILTLTHSGALGVGPKTVQAAGGGEIHLQNNITLAAGINFTTSGNPTQNNTPTNRAVIYNDSGSNTINGNISMGSGNGSTIISSDSGLLTINGNMAATATGRTLNLRGNGNGLVTGIISSGSTVDLPVLKDAGTGTWTLSGPNTYSGQTRIAAGALSINSIGNVGGGSSAIGAPATAGNGMIVIGNAATTGTLVYTGSLQSTDRTIQIGTNSATPANTDSGGATIQNDGVNGAGALTFSAPIFNTQTNAATGEGANRTLTLQGSNTDANTITGVIRNNLVSGTGMGTAVVSLTKDGVGTWALSGTNTYTGATTVTAGTLLVNGSLADSDVSVASGAVLGGTGTLGGDLQFDSGAILNIVDIGNALKVTGNVTFSGFGFGNITGWDFAAANLGTYTLIDGANVSLTNVSNQSINDLYVFGEGKYGYFQSGSLQVVVVPEPGTLALLGLGSLGLALRRRRN